MVYLVSLVVDGLLSGAVYGLMAMGLVVTYKASRAVNFAFGEWMTLGAVLAAGAASVMPWGGSWLGLAAALFVGWIGMQALTAGFARTILAARGEKTVLVTIMLTLGLGIFLRGAMDLVFAGVPRSLSLPFGEASLAIGPVTLAGGKLTAAVLGLAGLAAIGWFYKRSRTGIALRAMADDRRAAEAVGIDARRYLAIAWGLGGSVALVTGVLWMALTSGGFGLALLGLKILPVLMLGGMDSVGGTLVAALLVGVLESVTAGYLDPVLGSGLGSLVPNILLILIMLVRPTGLFGEARAVRL